MFKSSMTRANALLLALVLALGFSGGAMAQEVPQLGTDFDENQLSLFVEVQSDIQEIRVEYSERLATIEDPEQATVLQEEAGQLMVDAVEDKGLEVETYNMIAFALQNDPELLERVQTMMN
ncbi:DUF4168 domain-containing protein [Salinispirillum marinum]|uniref:DUF4168 domain-containing protein n=2 Tax=Saccharospirillaceae TaxID=255527 RepID=A0ABV8BFW5_9GAMM